MVIDLENIKSEVRGLFKERIPHTPSHIYVVFYYDIFLFCEIFSHSCFEKQKWAKIWTRRFVKRDLKIKKIIAGNWG